MFFYAPGLFIVMLEPVLVLVSFSLSPFRPMRAGTHVFGTLINLILKCNQVSLFQLNSNYLEFHQFYWPHTDSHIGQILG